MTIDVMGTQKEISKTIIKEGEAYVLALKENYLNFYEDAALYFKEEILPQSKSELEKNGQYTKTEEKSHWRYEKENVIYPVKLTGWKTGLNGTGCVGLA